MAAYLRFYHFESSPFDSSSAKRGMVLGTRSLKGALGHVKQGLGEGSPRVCLSGSEGVGKTSFCRALPKLLADTAQVVVVLDPRRPWQEIRKVIAKKFNLAGGAISRKALMAARDGAKQLVLVIDQAELLSHESLDHLDILLQYKCDEGTQLLHCVMLANLDAASSGTEIPLLWWLDRFTTMQLQFSPIPVEGLRHYVEKHLAKAGWAGGELFTEGALAAIHCNTGGLPRAINELCERILIEGGVREISSITDQFIEELCGAPRREPAPDRAATMSTPSATWSIDDVGTSPTAQEMLDATPLETPPPRGAEIDMDRRQPFEPAPDIASLLLNQDSPETLRVAPEVQVRKTSSSSLELEDDPTPIGQPSGAYEDSFCGHSSVGRAPIAMTRSPVGSRPRRGSGRMVVGLTLVAVVVGAIYSEFSVPTELLETAEVKIAETLRKQTRRAPTQEAEAPQDPAKESSLPPSILDRADEIAAESALDLVPPPGETKPESAEPASIAEVAAVPESEPVKSPPVAATRPSPPSSPTRATTPAPPAAATTPSTASLAKSAAEPVAKSPVTEPKASTSFTDDMLVINEYTAIPAAASTPPKLPVPAPSMADSDRSLLEPLKSPLASALAQESAEEASSAPPTPAKIAPDAKSDEPDAKLNSLNPATHEAPKVEPAKSLKGDASNAP